MNKRVVSWIVGVVAVSLLVVGVAVFAGNGLGRGTSGGSQAACLGACRGGASCPATLDADGDGLSNGQVPGCSATCGGSGVRATPRGGARSCAGGCS
jgi:hypothetical protein